MASADPPGTGGRSGPEKVAIAGPVTQWRPAAAETAGAPGAWGPNGGTRSCTTADDGPARETSFADVPATVAARVAGGIAEPGRVGAHGRSYGGHLTLVALTRWPDLFAAGATLAGMSDLRTFFAGTEPWMAAASVPEYGDPVADRELLAALSPMTGPHRLTSPVLLAHGDRDTDVPVTESVQAHRMLRALATRSDLLLRRGEGHAIVGRQHPVEPSGRVAALFARWL